jgi:hypothetical protein
LEESGFKIEEGKKEKENIPSGEKPQPKKPNGFL